MENIVDYLVVLFFILSFLSSLFKKKKTPPVNSKKQTNVTRAISANKKKQSGKGLDPFEAFFDSLNAKTTKPYEHFDNNIEEKGKGISEVDTYFEDALQKSTELEMSSSQMPISTSRTIVEEPILLEKIEGNTNSIKSYKESVKFSKERRESKKAKEIQAILRNKDSIKNYIIMNEILGKPKALQE